MIPKMDASVIGQDVNFIVQGEGPPVILIHGMAASLNDWGYLIPALAEGGYRAYALDLLGHGDSPKPEAPEVYRFDGLYSHLDKWIRRLGLQLPAWLVGHSLGGSLAIKYALNHPDEVRGLVLVDPFYSRAQLTRWVRLVNRRPALGAQALRRTPQWIVHLLTGWEPNRRAAFPREIRQQIALDYKRASPLILNIPRSMPSLAAHLWEVEKPTLVLWGDRDQTLKPASFATLVSNLPEARGQAIPFCGHQPHLAVAQEFNQLVMDFIVENQTG